MTTCSNDNTGIKRSAEEASLHDNESGTYRQQPFSEPVILPMNLIIGSILPFLQDRSTWNNLCFANKKLRKAGQAMTPPWPETTLPQVFQNWVMDTVFSPCGRYLVCGTTTCGTAQRRQSFVHILERRHGQQTPLRGHIEDIFCLTFSGDGKYLASGGNDRLIRIWPTDNGARQPQQSEQTLPGHLTIKVRCLAFSSDSNLLASGSSGEIKLWNVEDGVCIQTFVYHHGSTSSLVFSGVGESIKCFAATTDGSLIRISRSSSHSEFTSDIIVVGSTRFLNSVFSSCGSFLATMDLTNTLCLYEIKTDGTSTPLAQSVTLPAYCILKTNAGMAFSPDNKTLAVISDTSRHDDTVVRLLDVKDLTLQRQLKWQLRDDIPVSLSVDPSSRYLATACSDGTVRLWTL
jgi:WD40 repeat protein